MHEHREKLKGFRLSPNPYADNLEKFLGIQFHEPPTRIKMDRYNSCIAFVLPLITRRHFDLFALFLNFGPFRWSGAYSSRYNVFFDKTELMFAAHHENMHAYIEQVNPQINQQAKSLTDTEMAIVMKCVNEGIAEWGAIRTGLRMPNNFEKRFATQEHNRWLSNSRDDRKLSKEIDYALSQIKELEAYKTKESNVNCLPKKLTKEMTTHEAIQELKDSLRGTRSSFRASSVIRWASYSAGYYFVYFVMEELTKRVGTKAINMLILNPPTKLNELKNPHEYIQLLLHR